MSKNLLTRAPKITILWLLAILLLITSQVVANSQPADPISKIEAQLLSALSAQGQVDFIIRFAEQADLSAAYQMAKLERREYVYQTLKKTAERSQAQAKGMLDAAGLDYQTFIAGNDLYVKQGNLETASTLAALQQVASIRATRTYQLDLPVEQPLTEQISWSGDLLAQGLSAHVDAADATIAWGILDTKADQFWATFGVQGDGIKVADISSGVQWDHPALDQAYACLDDPDNPACWEDPYDICPDSIPCDDIDYGTAMVGIMVGDDDPSLTYIAGMAPNATWIACKGCVGSQCPDLSMNICADWILAPGGSSANAPDIVNNSWGSSPGGGDIFFLAKVNAWRAAGIFPAFSSGNFGPVCGSLTSPGDYQESFGSAAHASSRTIASSSSRGPSVFGHDPYTKPNISAPGVNICSSVPTNSWNCTNSVGVTSPHSSGAVALLWSCNPYLAGNIDMTFQALQNSADLPPAGDCGAPADGEGNYTYGYGYLNVLAAGQQYCSWKPWITPAPTGTPTRTSTPTITRTPTCTPTTVPPDRFTNILPYTLNNLITYFVGPWEREPNNTYETANGPLMLNQAYYGYPNDSEDRFYFILEEPGTLTINLTNYTASGAQLLLYGADPYLGHLVVDNTAPFQIVYAASAGQYYLRIYAVKDFNTTQPYTLSIAVPALRLAQATPPASGVTLTPPAP